MTKQARAERLLAHQQELERWRKAPVKGASMDEQKRESGPARFECWTCDDHRCCWALPCRTSTAYHRPLLSTQVGIDIHRTAGHDVRPAEVSR